MKNLTLSDLTAHSGWCSSSLERRRTPQTGAGLFARESIDQGDLLAVWGGFVVTTDELHQLPEEAQHFAIQVEAQQHLISGQLRHDADYVNHSCDPNAGLSGPIALVALRQIAAGEEICFDYAMSEADPEFRMECRCGSAGCRKTVTGDDWKIPGLQARYRGNFSTYIQRLIDLSRRSE